MPKLFRAANPAQSHELHKHQDVHGALKPAGLIPRALPRYRTKSGRRCLKCDRPSTGWTLWSAQGLSPMAGRRLSRPLAALLVVTTIPYNYCLRGNTFADDLWRTGAMLRKSYRTHWLVLHHEPAAGTSISGPSGDPELFYKIQECRPSFGVS